MAANPLIRPTSEVIRRCRAGTNADAALREVTRENSATTPAFRRAMVRAVHAYFRWAGWLDRKDTLAAQIEAAMAWQARYDRNPRDVKDHALPSRAVPAWAIDAVDCGPADAPETAVRRFAWLRTLQVGAPLWLRTRPGRGVETAARLGAGSVAQGLPAVLAPDAVRYDGPDDLFQHPLFQEGLFQIQDIASQAVGTLCAAQPGETWWDACAGEGGKSLHLADLMMNKGIVWCSDRSIRRLETLKLRFKRANLFNFRVAPWEDEATLPTKTKFDGVLVDAPCSGLGTWSRHPDARWTTSQADVAQLAAVQRRLLDRVADSLKPGGRLVYAVCTLTRAETTDVAQAFAAAHPEFDPLPLELPAAPVSAGPKEDARPEPTLDRRTPNSVILWPQDLAGNGMFVAAWRRK